MDATNKHNTQINHITWDFNMVHPQDGSYVHKLYLLYLYVVSLTTYSSLSVDPCGSLHACSISQLLVSVRLLPLRPELELGFYNSLLILIACFNHDCITVYPTN